MSEEPNYNRSGKDILVVYQCPKCGRNDLSCVPPKMRVRIHFFVTCDCGSFVTFQRAWVIPPPKKAVDYFIAWVSGDEETLKDLKGFENGEPYLEIGGTMVDSNAILNNPQNYPLQHAWLQKAIEKKMREDEIQEHLNMMFG